MLQSVSTTKALQAPSLSLQRMASRIVPLAAGVAILAAALGYNGHFGWMLSPVLFAVYVWVVLAAPVRVSFMCLAFLALATDRPGDSSGLWASPFVEVGGLVAYNMSNVLGWTWLKLSGILFTTLALVAVRVHRSMSGRYADTRDCIVAAAPLNWSLAAGFATISLALVWGIVNRGELEMAKVQSQVYLPMLAMAFVLGPSLRGDRDYRAIAKVLIAAASCKAVMALWARHVMPDFFPDQYGVMREVEYATSHGDSLLFAAASLAVLVPLYFEWTKRRLMWAALLMPLLVAGMIANDRRLVWVEVAIGLVMLPITNPAERMTRRLMRLGVLMSPLLLVYVGVGWFSASPVFGPVKTLRSMVSTTRSDGSIDRSTLFRDVENYNLVYTFRLSPVLGQGLGRPFAAAAQNDDLSGFKDYPYLPHNSVLGLMAFTGVVGVAGILLPILVAYYFAARVQRLATDRTMKMAVAIAAGNLGAFLMHMFGDIGFTEPTAIFTVSVSLAVAAQMAVASGAWRVKPAPLPRFR